MWGNGMWSLILNLKLHDVTAAAFIRDDRTGFVRPEQWRPDVFSSHNLLSAAAGEAGRTEGHYSL